MAQRQGGRIRVFDQNFVSDVSELAYRNSLSEFDRAYAEAHHGPDVFRKRGAQMDKTTRAYLSALSELGKLKL